MVEALIKIYIFLLVVSVIGFYIWMRNEMQNRGRTYPIFNSSFKIYVDFMDIASTDSKFRKKKNRAILSALILWITVCIFLTLYLTS